jgi:OmcA/MtrC family decaheme c-type cytochrome
LAYLPPTTKGEVTDYVAYTTRSQKSPITGVTAIQAGTDSGGTYTPSGLNDGVYTYKFATALPSNYITTATHTLGIYATRNLTEFGLTLYVSNVTKDWVPSGAAVTQVHKVVLTQNCNQCHDPLALHGSTGRRAVEICILCHNPGVIDPDTGNTVDMKVMVHKIHRAGNLPSVKAGTPYVIIGNAQSVNDYSDITYPQDIRNCQTCHKDAAQVNAWSLQPSMDACGSCHDDINFATGANHNAGLVGPLADNSKCAQCHQPQGQFEFDASVIGAHTVPYKSKQLLNPKVNIFSVSNTAPGQKPILRFSITDKNGALIPLSQFTGTTGRVSVNFAGPTTDYSVRASETLPQPSGSSMPAYVNGVATYNFAYTIPATATGTWVMETEVRLQANLMINGDPKNLSASQRDAALNTTTFIAVTDRTPVARRSIVSIDNCNKCHDQLGKASFDLSTFHGGGRNQAEVCSICHTTTFVASTTPISFQVMIHRIHTGADLTNSYVVGGTDFKEVTYPGDRRDCAACHVGTSYQVPLPATNLAVTTPNWYWTPTLPISAACLGCHDTTTTAAHAFINTTVLGGKSVESCEVCHKEKDSANFQPPFAVTKVHAR